MAELTDLPDEVLTLIFRNFLSSTLTNHSYLCKWNTDKSDRANRANLCRLASVCKTCYAVAMPILFEHLLSDGDVEGICGDKDSMRVAAMYVHHTTYACISLQWDDHGHPPGVSRGVRGDLLTKCKRIKHLKVLRLSNSKQGDCLAFLAGILSGFQLQSLCIPQMDQSISLEPLLRIYSLEGLEIGVHNSCKRSSSSRMPKLKELVFANRYTDAGVEECISFASPHVLQRAGVALSGSTRKFHSIFGKEEWTRLEELEVTMTGDGGTDAIDSINLSRLPALRSLTINPDGEDAILHGVKLPTVPRTVERLAFGSLNIDELREILLLAQQPSRLGEGLKCLQLDLNWLKEEGCYTSGRDKRDLLLIVSQTVAALQERSIQVEPSNLQEVLADIITARS